ncbi:MAG: ABC transporter substrate-binding protein [Candidatus Hadarchaeum sp.]|uniref:ABC transporter substrate-binding protein n=1 Tax=Candidatus Hadarchaeum sp. TaxID=2883567 RepID=UPI0031757424
MNRLLIVLIWAAVLGLTADVCASPPVRFGVDSFILGAQIRVALEKGIFQKYGIDAEVLTFSYGVNTLDAILTGQSDFGVCMDFAMLTRLKTDKLVILATIIEPEPGWHKLVATADVKEPKDLMGKTMGVAPGTLQQYVTFKYLDVNGIPRNAVKYVELPALFDIVAALGRGIDAAWVWGTGTDEALKIPGIHLICDDSAAGHRSYGFLVASADFVRANRDLTVAIIESLIETTDWIVNNLEEAATLVAKQIGAPRDTVLMEMKRERYCLKIDKAHTDALQNLVAWMYETGLIERLLSIEYYVNTALLWMADPTRVRIHL